MPLNTDIKLLILKLISNNKLSKWQIYNKLPNKIGVTPDMIYSFLAKYPGVIKKRERGYTTFFYPVINEWCSESFVSLTAEKYE